MTLPNHHLERGTLQRLLEVSRQLGISADLDSILSLIIDAMRDLLAAERATVFEYNSADDTLFTTVAHGLENSAASASSTLTIKANQGIAGLAAKSKQTINIEDAYKHAAFNRSFDEQTGFRTKSILAIPLISIDDELIGVAQVLNKLSGDTFADHDVHLAEALASQAAVAIKRARLVEDQITRRKLEREIELARVIQLATFPESLPELADYQIGTFSQSADSTGGDTHDVFPLHHERATPAKRMMLLVADATGHGVGPALLATSLRAMLRMGTRLADDLSLLATQLNAQLCEDLPMGHFITTWLACLDSQLHTMQSLSAGQAPLLHFHATTNTVERLTADTIPLGITTEIDSQPIEITLEPGDIFAVFSDGYFEAADANGEHFGTARVSELIRNHAMELPDMMIASLNASIDQHTACAPLKDDRTALILKRIATP